MIMLTSEGEEHPQIIKIGNKVFEEINNFQRLGNVDNEGRIRTVVTERITTGHIFRIYEYYQQKIYQNFENTNLQNINLIQPVANIGLWTMTKIKKICQTCLKEKILGRLLNQLHRYYRELDHLIKGEKQ